MKVTVALIVIFLKYILVVTQECSKLSLFLKSYINHIEPKYSVEGFFCYEQEKLFKIQKCLDTSIQKFNRIENIERVIDNLTRNNKILFIFDFECKNVKNYFENLKNEFIFKQPNHWLMLAKSKSFIPDIQNLPDSNTVLAKYEIDDENDDGYNEIYLESFYKIESNSSTIHFEPYGVWSKINGLNITQNDRIISRRRRNLHGKILISSVVVTNNDSINHLEDYRDKHIDSITKTNYNLVKYLIESLNGTMKCNYVDTWGYKDPKTGKTLYGMIDDLYHKRADIGGTPLFITMDRFPKIQYISMTIKTTVHFIFREPPLSYVTNIYSLPFTSFVWICSLSLVILCIIVIFLTTRFELKLKGQADNVNKSENYRLTDYIIMGIGAICQMGSMIQPKIASARISTIFLLISLLFLYTSYTANIVALLQSTTKSIQTLQDLLDSSMTLAAEDTPYHRYYFPAATGPITKDIYRKKMLTPSGEGRYLNVTTGIDRVRRDFFAFHVELGVGYKIIKDTFYEHEKCNLRTVDFLQVIDPWTAIQRDSPYKEMLKVNLFKIREHGLQSRERSKIYTDKPTCSAKGQNFGSVRLTDCHAVIVIFLTGCALSVALLFLEIIFSNQQKLCLL